MTFQPKLVPTEKIPGTLIFNLRETLRIVNRALFASLSAAVFSALVTSTHYFRNLDQTAVDSSNYISTELGTISTLPEVAAFLAVTILFITGWHAILFVNKAKWIIMLLCSNRLLENEGNLDKSFHLYCVLVYPSVLTFEGVFVRYIGFTPAPLVAGTVIYWMWIWSYLIGGIFLGIFLAMPFLFLQANLKGYPPLWCTPKIIRAPKRRETECEISRPARGAAEDATDHGHVAVFKGLESCE